MKFNDDKAKMLIEMLPYIEKHSGKTMVIKYGGNAMKNERLKEAVMEDIILMSYVGINIVVVHGGGPEINKMLDRLKIQSEFINGLRYTDEDTMEVVEMVLAGKVNKELVLKINERGGKAVGLCGIDGNMLICEPTKEDLGYVGKIVEVNPEIIKDNLDAGYISMIATVGADREGNIYNVNGDIAGSAIAGALKEKYILLTDVPGLLEEPSMDESLISHVYKEDLPILFENGTITGGMIPKINSCIDALNQGVKKVHILDGRVRHSIITELFTDAGVGTLID
jgi:acetylglutamate kinase